MTHGHAWHTGGGRPAHAGDPHRIQGDPKHSQQ
jgi:hypothetical protein